METTYVTTTRNADYVALGTGGQRVMRCWDQITHYLERAIGPAHARLFAEPTYNATTGSTDWYAAGEGKVARLTDLPPAEQEAARARLNDLLQEIRAAAERLRNIDRADEKLLSELLGLAMIVPVEDAVWVLRDAPGAPPQPVLAGWGQTLNGEAPAPELLLGIAGAYRRPAGRPPMRIVGPPPPPPAPRRWGLWSLLAALLLALLLFVLLLWRDPFGWLQVGAAQCVVAPGHLARLEELRGAEAREAQLRQEIARLSLELGDRRTACPPAPAPPAPPRRAEAAPGLATPPTNDVQRAEQRGARSGNVQIILAWDDVNDLDLHVTCPNGGRIGHQERRDCGGELDTDANVRPPLTRTPVENIVFATRPADGTYRIAVVNIGGPGPAMSRFRVTIRQEGQPDRVLTGEIARQRRVEVGTFQVPP